MAINAYTGLMGSGKSYEVVSSVILPAVKAGRRVVSNIDGLNEQKIKDHLIADGVDEINLGCIILVTNDDITPTGFFPDETQPDHQSIVQPGDLVCIDEAWRFWPAGKQIPAEHQQFFRMHRHYVADTGVACDVALIIQSIGDLHRNLRAVIEISFKT